jgi:hypothetical protein
VPVKQRHPKQLRPQFSREAVALFAELEGMRRGRAEYQAKSRRLHANLLGVGYEWFCGCSDVNDRRSHPQYPESSPHFEGWLKVRANFQKTIRRTAINCRRKGSTPSAAFTPIR